MDQQTYCGHTLKHEIDCTNIWRTYYSSNTDSIILAIPADPVRITRWSGFVFELQFFRMLFLTGTGLEDSGELCPNNGSNFEASKGDVFLASTWRDGIKSSATCFWSISTQRPWDLVVRMFNTVDVFSNNVTFELASSNKNATVMGWVSDRFHT